METYSSENARGIYLSLQKDPTGVFPVTVRRNISGEILNLVYGHHTEVPGFESIEHLDIEGIILIQKSWEEVKKSINILLGVQEAA